MNLAVAIDPQFKNYHSLTEQLDACMVLQSDQTDKLLAMADMALQLDSKQFLEDVTVDYVLYAVDNNVKLDAFKSLLKFDGAMYNTVWYTNTVSHCSPDLIRQSVSGNFYCSPKVFSIMGSSYKIDPNTGVIQNFIKHCFGKGDENFAAVYYLNERTGIASHCLP